MARPKPFRFEGGYLYAGTIAGIPLRLHFTLPLICFLVGGFHIRPLLWALVIGIVLWHELGHAAIVRLVRARVVAVDLAMWGGLCHWRGDPPPLERALIAWGGVLAQLVLAIAAVVFFAIMPPSSIWEAQAYTALVSFNLSMAAFNLLPIAPLDGARAWHIVPELAKWWRKRKRTKKERKVASGHLTLVPTDKPIDQRAVERDLRDLLDRTAREVNVRDRGDA
jgi:Zn-dependent protease